MNRAIRHIMIQRRVDPRRGVRGVSLGRLCGSPMSTPSSWTTGEPTCPQCELLMLTLRANVAEWWLSSLPFWTVGYYTLAARFYALTLLRSVEESTVFDRWTAAKVFDYLQQVLTISARVVDPRSDKHIVRVMTFATGCHCCGMRSIAGTRGWGPCGVCGTSRDPRAASMPAFDAM